MICCARRSATSDGSNSFRAYHGRPTVEDQISLQHGHRLRAKPALRSAYPPTRVMRDMHLLMLFPSLFYDLGSSIAGGLTTDRPSQFLPRSGRVSDSVKIGRERQGLDHCTTRPQPPVSPWPVEERWQRTGWAPEQPVGRGHHEPQTPFGSPRYGCHPAQRPDQCR